MIIIITMILTTTTTITSSSIIIIIIVILIIIDWPLPKVDQVLKCKGFFFLGGYDDWLDLFTWPFRDIARMSYERACRMREIMANFSGAVLFEMILTPMHILRPSILYTLYRGSTVISKMNLNDAHSESEPQHSHRFSLTWVRCRGRYGRGLGRGRRPRLGCSLGSSYSWRSDNRKSATSHPVSTMRRSDTVD